MQSFKAAIIQIKPEYDKVANINHAISLIKKAADTGAQLITLPEIFFYPYELLALRRVADDDNATVEKLQEAAQKNKVHLCTGSIARRTQDGKGIQNTAYLIAPSGEVLLSYSKCHLFDVTFKDLHVRESLIFTPGTGVKVAETPLGAIGMLICYDIRFPELARTCVLKGAEILIVPAAFNTVTGPPHWHTLFRARAIENQVYILAASQARIDTSTYHAYGHSLFVDPWGTIQSEAGIDEEIIYADFDKEVLDNTRQRLPLLKQRRPDIYSV